MPASDPNMESLIATVRNPGWQHGYAQTQALADALEQAQAEVKAARRAALLDAAGDVCGYCVIGDKVFWARGQAYHPDSIRCRAGRIHARIKEEGL